MSFPLYYFFVAYLIGCGIFIFFFVANFLHLVGTGTFTKTSMLLTASLIVLSLGVMEITWELIAPIDLSQSAALDSRMFRGSVEESFFN